MWSMALRLRIENIVQTFVDIRTLSIIDFGAINMIAIYDDGKRLTDFADMYALCRAHWNKFYTGILRSECNTCALKL